MLDVIDINNFQDRLKHQGNNKGQPLFRSDYILKVLNLDLPSITDISWSLYHDYDIYCEYLKRFDPGCDIYNSSHGGRHNREEYSIRTVGIFHITTNYSEITINTDRVPRGRFLHLTKLRIMEIRRGVLLK